jgi:hypothetical protein
MQINAAVLLWRAGNLPSLSSSPKRKWSVMLQHSICMFTCTISMHGSWHCMKHNVLLTLWIKTWILGLLQNEHRGTLCSAVSSAVLWQFRVHITATIKQWQDQAVYYLLSINDWITHPMVASISTLISQVLSGGWVTHVDICNPLDMAPVWNPSTVMTVSLVTCR